MAPPSGSVASTAFTGAAPAALDAQEVDAIRLDVPLAGTPADPDFDLSSTFDVPAFLRRQEG
jgi:hypothetical protein